MKSNSKITILGLPFFAEKYKYLVDSYESLSMDVEVLINSNLAHTKWDDEYEIHYAGGNILLRMYKFVSRMLMNKPNYVDVYDYSLLTLFYLIIARLFKIKSRLWLIGGELKNDSSSLNSSSVVREFILKLKGRLTVLSLFACDRILVKEKHHIESISSIRSSLLEKTVFLHNCVPVEPYVELNKESINLKGDFLYANAVVDARRVDSMVLAIKDLVSDEMDFSCSIYGFNSISNDVYAPRGQGYSQDILNLIEELELQDCIETFGFVDNIKEVYGDFKFFVFPSDIVFANYALLESMSVGVVPIVYPGEGYDEIVVDGINGIVAFDYDLTKAFVRALQLSEENYMNLSNNAKMTIIDKYSLEKWRLKLASSLNDECTSDLL
ncbi:poly(glycerol-phosphate) alpha-glucosyltransferase [Vibrio maritimus]|uniref:Poly(Glycerol-phosphate) alpha-glucosyltransferase n=1 Tax=Vibrio maritimus TaxID=990268 RepID=A0A090S5L9_9VIBR|nr:poly(glycerol-phosphate) alpha-glucosyltransferase [Vibrio maritimus]